MKKQVLRNNKNRLIWGQRKLRDDDDLDFRAPQQSSFMAPKSTKQTLKSIREKRQKNTSTRKPTLHQEDRRAKQMVSLAAGCAGTPPCSTPDSPGGDARHQHYRVRRQTVSGSSQRTVPPPPPPPPGPLAVLFLRLMAAVLSAETGPGHERQPRRTHGKPRREA